MLVVNTKEEELWHSVAGAAMTLLGLVCPSLVKHRERQTIAPMQWEESKLVAVGGR